jgi:hypothetical protein
VVSERGLSGSTRGKKNKQRPRRRQLYEWLRTGALAVGLGCASAAGAGAAHAGSANVVACSR